MSEEIETEVDALRAILSAEAEALTRADYAVMEDLADRKASLLEGLQADAMSVEDIAVLREMSAQNATLFEATLSGLRTVIDRLQQVARASTHLDTYTANGALQDLGPTRSSFEKRS